MILSLNKKSNMPPSNRQTEALGLISRGRDEENGFDNLAAALSTVSMPDTPESYVDLARSLAAFRGIGLDSDSLAGVAETLRVLKAHADRVEASNQDATPAENTA